MKMSRLTRDGTAEPVSRDQIFRHERGQGNIHFACSADHEQDWQLYPVDPYSCFMCDHAYDSAKLGRNPVSEHQIQPEYGDVQAEAGRDCRIRLAKPNSQARTRTGNNHFLCHLTTSRISNLTRLIHTLAYNV